MQPRTVALALALALVLEPRAHAKKKTPKDPAEDLNILASWMAGSFSSEAQARRDPEFRDVRLEIVPIWTERTDGRWFYVEQAVVTALDTPYRQRVYRLTRGADGTFISAVFTLKEPAAVVGGWRQEKPFASLTVDGLSYKEGCDVVLRRRGNVFEGGTKGESCPSDLRRATYATSEVEITAKRMETLDRGFDAEGKQVWGSTRGSYRFDRNPATPPREP